MKYRLKQIRKMLAAVMMLALLLSLFASLSAFAEEAESESTAPEVPEGTSALQMAVQTRLSQTTANRFNIMMVLDASGSMSFSDPRGLRFEAMKLFANLLPDEGNVLGGEVFSTLIDREVEPRPVSGQAAKDTVVDLMSNVRYPGGWTNIGSGLRAAANALETHADKELPSVIILLSDGNTAMPDQALEKESRFIARETIDELKKAEIEVYCVCLNVNGAADISEMQTISSETGGKAMEIRRPEDLNEVFQTFYDLIYGTKRILLADEVFPESGRLETPFDVPGFAVEEVNIIIQGNATNISLVQPSGREGEADRHTYETFTALKITEIVPGMWTLITEGVPGEAIKIEVVYNSSLEAVLFNDAKTVTSKTLTSDKPVTFYMKLVTSDAEAEKLDYYGFEAELAILNEKMEEIRRVPMDIGLTCFENIDSLEPGEYYFVATVTGPSLIRDSNRLGPLVFKEPEPEKKAENTAPTASQSTLKKTVIIWPVAGGKWVANVGSLVSDKEDPVLKYSITNSTFGSGAEARVDAGGTMTLKLGNFRLKGGSLTVRATDSEGLYCDVRLDAKVINTVVILLGLLGVGLIGGLVYWLMNREHETPVSGSITVSTEYGGAVRTSSPQRVGKRKLSLSHFPGIDNIGLDYSKCYFQGANEVFVFLVTDRPVRWRGSDTKEVRVDTGIETTITIDDDPNKKMIIRYEVDRTGF